MLLGMRLRSSPSFVDSIDSFGSKAHNIENACIWLCESHMFQTSWLLWLSCCGLEVKSEQCIDQLTVCEGLDQMELDVSFLFLACLKVTHNSKGSQTSYQFIWGLSRLDLHIFQLVYLTSLRHSTVCLRC